GLAGGEARPDPGCHGERGESAGRAWGAGWGGGDFVGLFAVYAGRGNEEVAARCGHVRGVAQGREQDSAARSLHGERALPGVRAAAPGAAPHGGRGNWRAGGGGGRAAREYVWAGARRAVYADRGVQRGADGVEAGGASGAAAAESRLLGAGAERHGGRMG